MKIIVAQIQSVSPHPEAQKLTICQVSAGAGQEVVKVVCGASNVRKGMKTILALPGSVTPQGLAIKPTTIRGEDSHGMLCSAKDLNLSSEGGIIDLPESVPLGITFQEVPLEFMSSVPWYRYQEVDAFWQKKGHGHEILIQREFPSKDFDPTAYQLISKTYFQDGKYLYRHFKH